MKKTGLIALSFMMCLGLCFNVRAEGSDETPTTNTDVRVEDVQKSVEGNPETEDGNSNQGSTEIDTSKMGVEIQSTADGTTLAVGNTFAFSVKTVGEVNGQIMVK